MLNAGMLRLAVSFPESAIKIMRMWNREEEEAFERFNKEALCIVCASCIVGRTGICRD